MKFPNRKSRLVKWLALSFVVALIASAAAAVMIYRQTGFKPPDKELSTALSERLDRKHLRRGLPVFIRVFKEESELELWMNAESGWELFRSYPVCRWSGTLGPKLREGDGQAPEGVYNVVRERLNPNSDFHLAMNIGYPNAHDEALGRTGSFIMIHGACVSIGCFAMTDAGIEDIYGLSEAALSEGQSSIPVHVFPFRMTDANMERHKENKWYGFWRDLQLVYHAFETGRGIPETELKDGRYRIKS